MNCVEGKRDDEAKLKIEKDKLASYMMRTFHGTYVFLNERKCICHATHQVTGTLPIYLLHGYTEAWMFVLQEEVPEFIREIYEDGFVSLSRCQCKMPMLKNVDGTISIGDEQFISARQNGEVSLTCNNKAWEHLKTGEASFYPTEKDMVRNSRYFDADWYKNHYNLKEDTDAARHYCSYGVKFGFYPSEKFSAMSYYALYDDVLKEKRNPLLDYEVNKHRKVYSYYDDIETISKSVFFDADWYKEHYHVANGNDAAADYLELQETPLKSASPFFHNSTIRIKLGIDITINPLIYVERRKNVYEFLEQWVAPLFC